MRVPWRIPMVAENGAFWTNLSKQAKILHPARTKIHIAHISQITTAKCTHWLGLPVQRTKKNGVIQVAIQVRY